MHNGNIADIARNTYLHVHLSTGECTEPHNIRIINILHAFLLVFLLILELLILTSQRPIGSGH